MTQIKVGTLLYSQPHRRMDIVKLIKQEEVIVYDTYGFYYTSTSRLYGMSDNHYEIKIQYYRVSDGNYNKIGVRNCGI